MIAVDVDKLKGEIADMKATIQAPNWGYVTGYISALSVVEGIIATLLTITLDDLRPKGRWVWEDDGYCRCSRCTQKAPVIRRYDDEQITAMTVFCPYCGADMRGGGDDA